MRRKTRAILRIAAILILSLLLNSCLILFCFSQQLKNRVCSYFFRIILKACGIRVLLEAKGVSPSSNSPTLIVSNHISYLDILIISSLFPCIFLAKSEVGNWPLFGWVAQSLGCVFVRRNSLMGRAIALRTCLKRVRRSSIAIFPEGTTTAFPQPDLQNWTAGHAWIAKKSSIQHILCLRLSFDNQAERAWTDDISLMPHLFATLQEERIHVKVAAQWTSIAQHSLLKEVKNNTWRAVVTAGEYAST